MSAVASPDVVRSFTAGNLGIGSVYGNTPFNLLAPSRLIYPVYTVYRNKFPRPPGQGCASSLSVLPAFTGIIRRPAGGACYMLSMSRAGADRRELWHMAIVLACFLRSQSKRSLSIFPIRFSGVTEQPFLAGPVRWAGLRGHQCPREDLISMLQEAMLGEEYQLIAGSSVNLATPAAPTCTVPHRPEQRDRPQHRSLTAIAVSAVEPLRPDRRVGDHLSHRGCGPGSWMSRSPGHRGDAVQHPTASTALLVPAGDLRGVQVHPPGLPGTPPAVVTRPTTVTPGPASRPGWKASSRNPVQVSQGGGVYPSGWQGGYYNGNVGLHLNYNIVYTTLKALAGTPLHRVHDQRPVLPPTPRRSSPPVPT